MFLTFYVEGAGIAPWIESIKTVPGKVKERDEFSVAVRVNDADLDELRLTTEVYYAGELIYSERKNGITAVNGVYPTITTAVLPDPAEVGRYEVVCTVRDWSGAGIGSYRFAVVSEGNIVGSVYHTDQWEKNRKHFNMYYFNEEVNRRIEYAEYLKDGGSGNGPAGPRKRGTNVFWAGERFLLSAQVAGNAESVTAQILGQSAVGPAPLHNTGTAVTAAGGGTGDGGSPETLWTGDLWNAALSDRLRSESPSELTFRFTAVYAGGATKTYDVKVIVDNSLEYWLLHRAW